MKNSSYCLRFWIIHYMIINLLIKFIVLVNLDLKIEL